jgi:serine/threonine protein phosphatase PrpC
MRNLSGTLSIQAAGRTDVGCVRTNNEDHFGYDLERGIFVVCDGMGGQAAGEVASRTAVETMLAYFRHELPDSAAGSLEEPANDLAQAVRAANERVWSMAAQNPAFAGMGSTIVALWLNSGHATLAHVGDSRAYLIHEGQMRQLTDDHSLVMEQVRRGLITREQAEHSEIQNIITRALGSRPYVEVDIQDLSPQPGDLLLLASDGLTRRVRDSQLLSAIQHSANLDSACEALIQLARQAGGEDNITCVLIEIAGES